jgi:SHS2 domain-containing protein
MTKFEFIEHTADVAFKAYGKDLNELFANAAEALESTLVQLQRIAPIELRTIQLASDSYENLLYDWLAELLVMFEVERFAVKNCKLKITGLSLSAECSGERIDLDKHVLNEEVKAVTYHNLQLMKNDIYHVEITLDV